MSILATLKRIAPEYAVTPDADLQGFIDDAALEINRKVFGPKADLATAYLAAHMKTLSARKGSNQGAVTGERVGDLGRTYAAPAAAGSASDEPYRATSYGLEFLRLRRTVIKGPLLL